ncbi:MAG: glutamate racemase [Anaerolineales bacterium]|nr:glutamate racemase [Anaerolineales bacterium]
MDRRPLGIFDSGVGGLSILKAVRESLPEERLLYFADQAHVPYGVRSLKEIRSFSEAITRFLIEEQAKMIIIACNTASGAALKHIRTTFPTEPIIGLEPAITPAARQTKTGKIAVLATKATLKSEIYLATRKLLSGQTEIFEAILEGIVEEIEAGRIDSDRVDSILRKYLLPLLEKGVDTFVLGCTHYPFVMKQMSKITGPEVNIIDPAAQVADHIARTLGERNLLAPKQGQTELCFYSTKDPLQLVQTARSLTGLEGQPIKVCWDRNRIQKSSC